MKKNKKTKQIFISKDKVSNRFCYCVVPIGRMGTGKAIHIKSKHKLNEDKK